MFLASMLPCNARLKQVEELYREVNDRREVAHRVFDRSMRRVSLVSTRLYRTLSELQDALRANYED